MMVKVKPIRTEVDYEDALSKIEKLFQAKPGTPDADRLEVLTMLVLAYEDEYYNIPMPDPVDAILYFIESRATSRQELEILLGSRARVSEILNRKRPLSLEMIRRLHEGLGIPAEVLIQPYEMAQHAS